MLLSACVSLPSSHQRQETATRLADSHKWQERRITTTLFDLVSYQAIANEKEKTLTVYIEGDGLAWLTKNTVSSDPTPVNPIGLKLALTHPQDNVVYLARPCQYTGGTKARNCNKHYWTDSRFAEEVIASTHEALNTLKAERGALQLQLVGYSGGAAVAALVAARRDDVTKLITVAGNLDHRAWSTHHHITPLSNSLNPADYKKQLSHLEQVHFAGSKDTVIPPFLAQGFVADFHKDTQSKVIIVPNQEHGCCWDQRWRDLITEISRP